MNNILDRIYNHPLSLALIEDSVQKEVTEKNISDFEHYKENILFYFSHFMSLLAQLDNAVELLNNFKYSTKSNVNRGMHLTYNVENYIIRIISINDRLLQLINAISNLNINENKVNFKNIFKDKESENLKILFSDLKNTLNKYYDDRHSIIHRHSIINKQLYQLETFYHPELFKIFMNKNSPQKVKQLKYVRSQALKRFNENIKKEFNETNNTCFEKIIIIFDLLLIKYQEKKEILQQKGL